MNFVSIEKLQLAVEKIKELIAEEQSKIPSTPSDIGALPDTYKPIMVVTFTADMSGETTSYTTNKTLVELQTALTNGYVLYANIPLGNDTLNIPFESSNSGIMRFFTLREINGKMNWIHAYMTQDVANVQYKEIASPEVFIATYGTTTNAEIEEAYQAGKIVFCKQEINEYGAFYIAPLTLRGSETQHMFTCANADFGLSSGSYMRFNCFDNQWNTEQIKIPSITTETTTLAVDGWESDTDGFKQAIAPVEVYTTGYVYTVYPNSAQLKAWGEAGIYADDITIDNEITFHCTDQPTVDILVNIKAEEVTS